VELRDEQVPLTLETEQLDPDELERLAKSLETLPSEAIEAAVSALPATWPVTDEELEAVIEFANARKSAVAGRLRVLVA